MNRTTMAISQVRKGACPRIRRVIKNARRQAALPDLRGMQRFALRSVKLCSRFGAQAGMDARAPRSRARSVIVNDSPTVLCSSEQQREASVRLVFGAQLPTTKNERRVCA